MQANEGRPMFWLMAVAAVILIMACGKSKPIQVGFVAGLSGRVADLGVAGRNGAMLAVEQVNRAGGVRGRKVELVVRDDRQDADTARKVVQELLSMDLEVIIGPMTSSMAMTVVPLVNASSALLVSPTVTTTELEGRDDRFLRFINTTREYASKSAHFQFETYGRRRAAAIYDLNNKSYTESWLRDFRQTFEELGGKVIQSHSFKSDNRTAFFAAIQNLLDAKPDLLVVITNAVDAALICQQVRKLDEDLPLVLSEWSSTERFIELGGKATEGVFVAQLLNREDPSAKYRQFYREYTTRFGQEPGFAGVAAYDAAKVVMTVLASRSSGQPLKQAILDRGKFDCLQQTITIDRFGDSNRSAFITVVRNGRFSNIQ